MALNPNPVGSAIAAYIQANKPSPGTPVTDAQLTSLWEGIMTIIYNDLKANAQVAPGSFVSPPGTSCGPISGLGGPLE